LDLLTNGVEVNIDPIFNNVESLAA